MLVHYETPEGEDKDIEYLTENSSDSDDTVYNNDFDGIPTISLTSSMFQPEWLHQSDLNDLVLDLNLSKELSELLASRLSKKNVLEPGTNVYFYGHRDREFTRYF